MKRHTTKARQGVSLLLALCMLLTLLPAAALAEEAGEPVTITAFDALDGSVSARTVPADTAEADLALPGTLTASVYTTAPDTASVTIENVIWTPDKAYEGAAGEVYTFTASAAGYVLGTEAAWPAITVTVEEAPAEEAPAEETPSAYDAAAALFAALPDPAAVAGMSDGEKSELSAQLGAASRAFEALPQPDFDRFAEEHGAELARLRALQDALSGGAELLTEAEPWLTNTGSGSGDSAEAAYILTSYADLEALAVKVNGRTNYQNKYFKLAENFPTEGTVTPLTTPIGAGPGSPFQGHFDGNHQTVELAINNSDSSYQGLFGYVNGGTVSNVTVTGSVTGKGTVGGVVGALVSGTVTNCTNQATITANDSYAGGVVGITDSTSSTVVHCTNSGTVTGKAETGGVTGYCHASGKIEGCTNTGAVNGTSEVGGIVGRHYGTVNTCSNSGAVAGTEIYVGGVAGKNNGTVQQCWNTGKVVGSSSSVGGIAGYHEERDPKVENCYNTGEVSGTSQVGGVVGYGYQGAVQTCWNTGPVTATSGSAGGIVGSSMSSFSISNCVSLGLTITGGIGTGRVVGYGSATLAGNKARADMKVGVAGQEKPVPANDTNIGLDKMHGAGVAVSGTAAMSDVFSGWDTGIWTIPSGKLKEKEALPTLQSNAPPQGGAPKLPEMPVPKFTADPAVKEGSVTDTAAKITFTTDTGGKVYYLANPQSTPDAAAIKTGNKFQSATANMAGSVSLSGLTAGTAQTVYLVLEDAGGTFSEVKSVTFTTLPAPPAATAAVIDYGAEKITFGDAYAMNTAADFTGDTINTGDSITGYISVYGTAADQLQKLYIRAKQSGTTPASAAAAVTIPARPQVPAAPTINYADETVTIPSGAAYSIQATGTASPAYGSTSNGTAVSITASIAANGGDTNTVYYRAPATQSSFASAGASLEIPARPAAPATLTAKTVSDTALTLNAITGAEYRLGQGAWQNSPAFTDLTAATKYAFAARIKATATAFHSAEKSAELYTLSAAPAVTEAKINYGAETISFGDAYEMNTAEGFDGTAISSGDSITGYISPAGTEESSLTKLYIRAKAVGETPASGARAIPIPARPATPAALTVSAKGTNSLTVAAASGVEYTVDDWATTSTTGVFIGLVPGTDYTVKARVAATESSFESEEVTAAASTLDMVAKYGISGKVTASDGSTPVADVTVTLKRGAGVISSTTTSSSGDYTFTDVPAGLYNVVAEKDSKIKTILVDLKADATGQNIQLPAESKSSVVEVAGTNTPPVMAGGVDAVAEAQTDAGTVVVKLAVEAKEAPADKGLIDGEAAGKNVELYLDLSLLKTVNGGNPQDIGDSNNKVLEIVVPYDLSGKENVTVYRVHNGEAKALIKNGSGADGTYQLDTANNRIHIFASKFSTYAVAYGTGGTPSPGPSGNGGGTVGFTLTATAGAGGSITPSGRVNVSRNGSRTFSITPDEGYEIADVLVDGRSVGAVGTYTFEKVTKNHAIAASFRLEGERPAWNPFADVKEGDWFYDAVKYVYENGLMNGTGKTTFSPDRSTTRSMIVTILWRLEGEPESGAEGTFADVKPGSYCYDAVRWAAEQEIVKGFTATTFGPDNIISRQQLAAILYRCAQYRGCDVSAADDLSAFTDRPDPWAEEAMKWAVGAGVFAGKANGLLDPGGQATRAQAAAMLQRFAERTAK